jgi:hypothetical protein
MRHLTMPAELTAKKTPVAKEELIKALYNAWFHLFNEEPRKESIWCLAAQWALETGWGASMWCYNLGNVKSKDGDGHDYCYFACNEILKKSVADAYAAKDPSTAKVTQYRGDGTAIIWFYPKHPGCRFRAFNTLLEGCIDYIALLNKRFTNAWPAVCAGNPAQFVHALKTQGYFTADEFSYSKTLVSVFNTISRLNIDYTNFSEITDDQKSRIIDLVSLTMSQSLDDIA